MSAIDNMTKAMQPLSIYSLGNYTAVYKELESYAVGLDILTEIADELVKECFIATASGYGLSIYEKLNGPERTDLTTEQRRKMLIQSVTLNCNDNTLEGVYKFFSSLGLECEITENPTVCDLYILVKGGTYSETEKKYIRDRAAEFLPCHLTFTVDFRTVNWGYLENLNLTFSEIEEKSLTWAEFENYEEE